jgi:hypothetical protein
VSGNESSYSPLASGAGIDADYTISFFEGLKDKGILARYSRREKA